jgi:magnesium-transporting ATPase (P-type)
MITGDNPLTAVHVARDVEIVDRDALILDLRENPAHEAGKFYPYRSLVHTVHLCRRFGLAHGG